MRINVYSEELTEEVELVSKTVEDKEFGKRTFYGVRMFLKSPDDLHHSEEDDDRNAITFWTKAQDADLLYTLLCRMSYEAKEVLQVHG